MNKLYLILFALLAACSKPVPPVPVQATPAPEQPQVAQPSVDTPKAVEPSVQVVTAPTIVKKSKNSAESAAYRKAYANAKTANALLACHKYKVSKNDRSDSSCK